MYFYCNVIAIVICLDIGLVRIHSDNGVGEEGSDADIEKNYQPTHDDSYTFLALIDVVFTDGSKRTCTGTIIHDNVVITAAHCLSTDYVKAELTASFVVIGTKKMFDAGYEQYLPIERVIIHPNYTGWTADLALVYTFAGMMSDKPGKVIRLANEKTSMQTSDMTVFSWGRCSDDEELITTPDIEIPNYDEDETIEKIYIPPHSQEAVRKRKYTVKKNVGIHSDREDNVRLSGKNKMHTDQIRHSKSQTKRNKKHKHLRQRKSRKTNRDLPTTLQKRFKKKRATKSRKDTTIDPDDANSEVISEKSKVYNKKKGNRHVLRRMSYYKNNWRRKMGNQKNILTAEIFDFVNTQTCSKLSEKSRHSNFELENPNEILCYANEAFYITNEDSGAPALRQGRLVAVTVGGIDYDGEHVAVGMKIICFCPWIVKNLPKSGNEILCCKRCCEPKRDDEHNSKRTHRKKKYDIDD